jgi:hypothetical protein
VATDLIFGGSLGVTTADASTHVSLLHWGLPPTAGAGAADAVAFVLLALAPLTVAWATWRTLEREHPQNEQEVFLRAFLVAIGFAVTAWMAALFGRTLLAAIASHWRREVGVALVRPAVASSFGLALLWGIAGAVSTAFAWSRRRALAWASPGPPGAAPPTASEPAGPTTSATRLAPPPPVPGRSHARGRRCSACGAPVEAPAKFCKACGAALP